MKFNVFLFYFIIINVNYYTYCYKSTIPVYNGIFNNNKLNLNLNKHLNNKKKYIPDVRGTQCYLPEQQKINRWIYSSWFDTSVKFGFQEYSMPVLAYSDLFRKPDEKSDNEHHNELYTFLDKKGRSLSLRGDITPQLMNMLNSKQYHDYTYNNNIIKLFTIADCWRYERPSYCRRRNHLQWNADIIGVNGLDAELELISLLILFFKEVRLTSDDIKISINHRNTISEILRILGFTDYTHEWYYKFSKIIDKYKKNPKNEINKMLVNIGFNENNCLELHRIFETCKSLNDLETMMDKDKIEELRKFIKGIEDLGYSDWVELDLSIVRGNDYYTGIVFECFDRSNTIKRSLAGGGRYDNYIKDSNPVLKYSAGFGMGITAITNLLIEKNLAQDFYDYDDRIDVMVFIPKQEWSLSSKDDVKSVDEENKEKETQEEVQLEEYKELEQVIMDYNREEEKKENEQNKEEEKEEIENTEDNNKEETQEKEDRGVIHCSIEQKKCLHDVMTYLRRLEFYVYNYYKTSKFHDALRFASKCKASHMLIPYKHNGKEVIVLKSLEKNITKHFDISEKNLKRLILHNL